MAPAKRQQTFFVRQSVQSKPMAFLQMDASAPSASIVIAVLLTAVGGLGIPAKPTPLSVRAGEPYRSQWGPRRNRKTENNVAVGDGLRHIPAICRYCGGIAGRRTPCTEKTSFRAAAIAELVDIRSEPQAGGQGRLLIAAMEGLPRHQSAFLQSMSRLVCRFVIQPRLGRRHVMLGIAGRD